MSTKKQETTDSKDKAITALEAYSKLQKHLTNPPKTTEAFKYKYAPLPDVLDHVRSAVVDCGFIIKQSITSEAIQSDLVYCLDGTVVASASLPMIETVDAQKMGSWITYMRRYGILTILNISAEDDDGEKTKNEEDPEPKTNEPFNFKLNGKYYSFREGISKQGKPFKGLFPKDKGDRIFWGDTGYDEFFMMGGKSMQDEQNVDELDNLFESQMANDKA